MKAKTYNWIWKWHFIGGLVSLPIVLLLSVTGTIYLFKDDFEQPKKQALKNVTEQSERLSYQAQWALTKQNWSKQPTSILLPAHSSEATEFISGRFSNKSSWYLDPFTGQSTGSIEHNSTDMHKVRKLHGELLMGSFGTKIVELIACWMVVLIVSGVFLFWPKEKGWKGLFHIRTKGPKQLFFRDLHAVTGFWFSIFLLLLLAGGLPWTDVWGAGFKSIQTHTNTGFPAEWQGHSFRSQPDGQAAALDGIVAIAKKLQLKGEVTITLPQNEHSVYSISNQTSDLSEINMYHLDQYSTEQLYHGTWKDIGILMKARLWAMAFHQGQFGTWNWILVLLVAFALTFLSIAALLSYAYRKKKGSWSIPSVPAHFKLNKLLIATLIILGVLLPLFGISVLVIVLVEKLKNLIGVKR